VKSSHPLTFEDLNQAYGFVLYRTVLDGGKSGLLKIEELREATDFRVPINQGLELFTALQRRGVPSKMVYFPDEGHWVLKPQNSKLWYQTVGDWFDQWLK